MKFEIIKKPTILLLVLTTYCWISCKETKPVESKAFTMFNEGVTFSLQAAEERNKENFEKSKELHHKAIDMFLKTMAIDSTHKAAPSALGHSYYMIRDFKNGTKWYKKAIQMDTTFVANYLELGLCQINDGDFKNGSAAINKAVDIDPSQETVDQAVNSLIDISKRAIDFGLEYKQEGDTERHLAYTQFAISVLKMAHQLAPLNREVMVLIADFSEAISDTETATTFMIKFDQTPE